MTMPVEEFLRGVGHGRLMHYLFPLLIVGQKGRVARGR
jgi:hypothetical protein